MTDDYPQGEASVAAAETDREVPEDVRTRVAYQSSRGGGLLRSSRYGAPDPRYRSPFLAAFLSLVPGLGQIYVGYYNRGFVNPLVVGGIISLLVLSADEPGPPFWFPLAIMFLVFFWLYNIIDAFRRAVMYNLALDGVENIQLPDDLSAPSLGGSLFGGIVLVLVGGSILLHTRFGLPIDFFEQWWPIAPIALGAYLIVRDRMDRQATADED